MNKQFISIIIFSVIIVVLSLYAKSKRVVLGTKANVVGNLLFTYPGGVTPETLFNELDFKPGDCKEAFVTVENLSAINQIVGVFSDGEIESDVLSGNLEITIKDEFDNILYGPLPLSTFFADSDILNQINLKTLTGNATIELHFIVCFPDTDDNELQGEQVVFDLKFGNIVPPIELPEECKALEGVITKVIYGTSGNDNIHGTVASELIYGYGGNDKIDPSSGSDCIIAGAGNDKVYGTTGNEIILGGPGNDNLSGGSGDDTIYGGAGNDKINGGSGDDNLYGGADNDTISGGSGKDNLYGNAGNDSLKGGSNDDYLNGGINVDNLNGQSGTDTCTNGPTYSSCEIII